MSLRRVLWTALLAGLAMMLVMWYLQRRLQQGDGSPSAPSQARRPAASTHPKASGTATSPSPASQPASVTTATSSRSAKVSPAPKQAGPKWLLPESEPRDIPLGSLDHRQNYKMQLVLTNRGAAVKSLKLLEHFETVEDKRRWENDKDSYPEAVKKDPKLKGHYRLLRPISQDGKTYYPLATRSIFFPAFPRGRRSPRLDGDVPRWEVSEVRRPAEGPHSVTFTCPIKLNGRPYVRLEKTYSLAKNSYSLQVTLRVVNLRDEPVEFGLRQYGPAGVPREDARVDSRKTVYGRLVGDEVKVRKVEIKQAEKAALGLKAALSKPLGSSSQTEPILWIGLTNKFFGAMTYIVPHRPDALGAPEAKATFFNAALAEGEHGRTFLPGFVLGSFELAPRKSVEIVLDVFAGPKQRDLFDNSDLYTRLRYKDTIDFRSCWCSFPWLALAMMWLLGVFSKVLLGNYGLAIILLVILVRLVLHPLTKKSQVSMMRMQKLQPEMAKIKEKYKDDKARQNEEIMRLYKSQGATPILGCLPMLLQLPILIALWTSINASVELRHAAFLPVWITDLAAPDAIVSFSRALHVPLIGNMIGPITGINLLPILLSVAMYLQTKLNPQMAGASTSPEQASTQKMMRYMMPGMMLLFFYNASSGLNLYFMASTFAGVAEQYVIRKHIREKEAAEAAVETRVAIPGKRFRGQKPKKPKGPFRFTR